MHQGTDLLHGEIREEYLIPLGALQHGGHEWSQAGQHYSMTFHSQSLSRHEMKVSHLTLVDQNKTPIEND